MTTTAMVVGCDKVDADSAWVRLHVAGGHLRTFDWHGITMAAVLRNNQHMTFKGDLEQITALRSTHDPLWMETLDGIAVVLLEKEHPKREAILAAFQENLGTRWRADGLSAQEAATRMFKISTSTSGGRSGVPKLAIIMAIFVILMFLGGMLSAYLKH